jgi:hypothetical protein
MKRLVLCLTVLGLLADGRQAAAVPGSIDAAPAATLLLPYFEVDLDNPNGVTTVFSVNNAVASAQLAHVTMWSTWSIPVLSFDVYLTGFDVQTFNVRNILAAGILSQTGSGFSSQGSYSDPNASFPNCNSTGSPVGPPVYPSPALNTTFQAHLRALLTGRQSPLDNSCAGRNYGDNIARGYITVDDANACSMLYPSSPDYFVSGGLGVAGNDNVLWGDYLYLDPGQNFAQGETLVHIQADATILNTPGEYTFYGRYIGGSAADNREPLPTSFATRYNDGGGVNGSTHLIVWRDAKTRPGVSCTFGPNFGRLDAAQIVGFDDEENVESDCRECGYFPDETQKVDVGANLPIGSASGWFYLNLNHPGPFDSSLGPGYEGIAQGWVVTLMSAQGRISFGYDAIQLDNANLVANPGGRIIPP